jgi:hypothetical protein
MQPQQLLVARILWASLLGSTVMLLGVAWFLSLQGSDGPAIGPSLALPMGCMALVTAALSVGLPPRVLRQALRALDLPVVERPAADRLFTDRPRRARVFAEPDQARRRAAPAVQTSMILALALAESVAIFGLALVALRAPLSWGIPFFVVAWVLQIARFPRTDGPQRALEQAYDADLE